MFQSKEEWVSEAARKLAPIFANVGSPVGRIQVEVHDSLSRGRLGECESRGDYHIIRIHSTLVAKTALPVLVHELLHAAVGVREGHRGSFIRVGNKIGLWADQAQNKAVYGPVSFPLLGLLRMLEVALGPYPKVDKVPQAV